MKNLLSFLCALLLLTSNIHAQAGKPAVIAYYTGNEMIIGEYPVASLTHIIYSFLKLDGDTLAFQQPGQQKILRGLVNLKKKYPDLKIIVSLGGWGGCKPCSDVFSDEGARRRFAASTTKLLKEYNADGIDLDWEYPGIEGHPGHPYKPEDVPNFTALVRSLRESMGDRYELSFAAGGFRKFLEQSVEWEKVMPLVNRVNLMTYDLVNGYSTVTGHHTPLHGAEKVPEATDNCVNFLLEKGVPKEKLVIGAAFYARVWKDVPDVNNGLFQSGVFKNSVAYKNFDKVISEANGFRSYWDETSKAPYSYNKTTREFATYDNERSIAAKSNYVKDKKLGGIMFWELTEDQAKGGLLDVINKTLVD